MFVIKFSSRRSSNLESLRLPRSWNPSHTASLSGSKGYILCARRSVCAFRKTFESYGLMSYHFQYVVFKVHVLIIKLFQSFRGDNEIRTRDLLLARQALSQLSYTPRVGLSGLEPPTSRLSGVRSNRLSYKPMNLASTYSPVPSPAKYYRPSVS